ncbi:MAG TPA: hypothetical protein VHO71_04945 [Caproiciproducens sp.]|nr:hypothetical protein [Caproiciproducens sp.]
MIYVEKGNEGYIIDEKDLGEYKARGFEIPEPNIDTMTVDEMKAYAEGKGIDLTGLTKKDDILAKIKGGQQ